jgi:hypothetical protein
VLILGDVLVYLVITFFGFIRHDLLGQSDLLRILATFVPFTLSWFALAAALGLFDWTKVIDPKNLWLTILAAMYASALGALLRGFWLNAPVVLVFVFVLMGLTTSLMFLWRGVYSLFHRVQNESSL